MVTVHPDPQKDLVFGGDKIGNLGIYDATVDARREQNPNDQEDDIKKEETSTIRNRSKVKQEEEEEGDEDDEPINTWTMKVHAGSISHLAVDKTSPHTVYIIDS